MAYKKRRKEWVCPKQDTKIEVKIQNFLKRLHINFYTHYWVGNSNAYQCDIFIPEQKGIIQKTIIECDGCYWHGCPICKKWQKNYKKQIEKDKLRTNELQWCGFKVIRLWEHEINNMKLNNFINKIQ